MYVYNLCIEFLIPIRRKFKNDHHRFIIGENNLLENFVFNQHSFKTCRVGTCMYIYKLTAHYKNENNTYHVHIMYFNVHTINMKCNMSIKL